MAAKKKRSTVEKMALVFVLVTSHSRISVQRLCQESGAHRSTVYRWLKDFSLFYPITILNGVVFNGSGIK